MKIVFHPEAYEEMIESAGFYEERDDGLGMRNKDFLRRASTASSVAYGDNRSYNSNSASASSNSSSRR